MQLCHAEPGTSFGYIVTALSLCLNGWQAGIMPGRGTVFYCQQLDAINLVLSEMFGRAASACILIAKNNIADDRPTIQHERTTLVSNLC